MAIQPMQFFNTHTHFKPFNTDEGVIRNAYLHRFNGIKPGYRLSAGLHPWHSSRLNVAELEQLLITCILENNPLALGECGIDILQGAALGKQIELLELQAVLAQKYKLPMILHVVKAWEQTFKVLKKHPLPLILHGFRNHIQVFEQFHQHTDVYLSIGPAILKPTPQLITLIRQVPIENLLAETDNYRISVRTVYKQIAALRDEDAEVVRMALNTNAKRIFRDLQFQ